MDYQKLAGAIIEELQAVDAKEHYTFYAYYLDTPAAWAALTEVLEKVLPVFLEKQHFNPICAVNGCSGKPIVLLTFQDTTEGFYCAQHERAAITITRRVYLMDKE